MTPRNGNRGFTLVEMAIVLAIIGLLIGGIVAGQSMIRASKLAGIPLQYAKFAGAVKIFKQKYGALPGDMPDATQFWGMAAAGSSCATTSNGALTCDGDGDGLIQWNAPNSNENYRFWQHLTNAGLIEGTYSGVSGSASVSYVSTSANSPSSNLANSLWFIWTWGTLSGNSDVFDGVYNNFLWLGLSQAGGAPEGALLTPTEAWKIDTKMDDGKPATGRQIVRSFPNCTTATNSSQLNADYNLNNTSIACKPAYPSFTR